MPSLQLSHGSIKVFGARGKWILYVITLWKVHGPQSMQMSSQFGRGLNSSCPCHSVGAIIRTIMWASAFSSLFIIFMKKMWKFLLKVSEELELCIFGSSSSLELKGCCADNLWDSSNIDLLTKSTGVMLKLQSYLNFSLGGKRTYFYHTWEQPFGIYLVLGYTLYWLWCNHETTHLFSKLVSSGRV